ncbi:MAG: ATP-dependent zinc metalloprotease FtsH [SAR202 cluster bacterium]|nr:ATP-dependent zinc metalloprotease FtsH [SAR202 cluster bacterium]
MNSRLMRNGFIYLLIVVAVLAIFFTLFSDVGGSQEIPIGTAVEMIKKGEVEMVEVRGDRISLYTTRQETFTSRMEQYAVFVDLLQSFDVDPQMTEIHVKGSSGLGSFFGLILNFLPLIFFGAVLLFMMRQAQGNTNQTFSFGRSKARMLVGNQPNVTFDDVAGAEEPKEELQEVVEFLQFPERFEALGARVPRGVLLVGPPGTGKTLLARAVAGEAAVPFFSISGSEFVEMFVGVGASRVRDLFDQAKRNTPCIVFIDEIDAVGRHRGAGLGGGHDEREQTLNQILVEMDGFETGSNVIILASTNRPDILDPALLRPGRFDRRVTLDNPDVKGREAILKVHVQGKPLAAEIDLTAIAKQTPGFSGADLANLVNEAAILAARERRKSVEHQDFAESIDRVIAGPARKSRVISDRDKEVTAYHEAGHALVGHLLPSAEPVAKISIVSRGQMGGYTKSIPDEESYYMTLKQARARLATLMGGRAAEETVFGEEEITTGAGNDIEQATQLARTIITRYGMSEKLGPRTFGKREELVFLGREISEQADYSDRIAEEIDDEVHGLINSAYQTAKNLVADNKNKLSQIAKYLIDNETVEGDDLTNLFDTPPTPLPEPSGAD